MILRPYRSTDRDDVSALTEAVATADGYPPLTEAAWLAFDAGEGEGWVVDDEGLVGFAFHWPSEFGSLVELAVRPELRADVVGPLLERAGGLSGAGAVWASDDETVAAAHELGYVEARRLVQLARPLPADSPPAIDADVTSFLKGDEDDVIAVNNAAFADHPDNAGWTRASLAERMGRGWFQPDDLLIARRAGVPVAICWTKLHPHGVGEIYIIGVHPAAQGTGLGRAMTLYGLDHLHRERGATTAMLYSEASNTVGVALYEGMGFRPLRFQRLMRRE